jgi:hypothetical protein
MADNNETRTGGVDATTEIVEAAKKEVAEKVRGADNDEKKRRLGEEVRREIKETPSKLQQIMEALKGQLMLNKIANLEHNDNGKAALRTLTKAVEIVKIEKTQSGQPGIISSQIAAAPQGLPVLEKLAEQSLNIPTAAAIEYFFSDFIFGDKEIVRAGEITQEALDAFKELASFDPFAAGKIKTAIKDAAAERKIVILPDEIEKKLKTDESKVNENGQMVSAKDEKERQKIFRDINQKMMTAIKDKQISFREVSIINDFLLTGEKSPELEEIVQKIGVPLTDIERYAKITQQLNKEILKFGIMESYAPAWIKYVREAQEEFSIENLKKYFKRDEANGRVTLSREDRQYLKDQVMKYLYLGLREIHEEHSESFSHLISQRQDIQYYITMIRQVVKDSFDKVINGIAPTEENRDLRYFLSDIASKYPGRVYSQAQVFHDIPFLARDLGTTEKIIDFIRYFFPSQLAEFFDDQKMFMTIARDEMSMFLRKYLVDGGNQYGGDLLSGQYQQKGVYWEQPFNQRYRERLKNRLLAVAKNEAEREYIESNDWKIEMAATYAEAIGVMTLLDGEILATSDPVSHFRNVHPLMSLLSAKHNWLTGRGRGEAGLISKYLLGMGVEMYPKQRALLQRLFSKKGFNPEAIKDEIDHLVEVHGEKIIDNIFNASGLYYQLLSMFNLPNSFNSWDGWRIQKIPQEFITLVDLALGKKINKKDGKLLTAEDWQKIFDFGFNLHGTSFLWWSIKGDVSRLSFEVTNRLKALGFSDEQIQNIKTKATENLISVDFNGQKRRINYIEFEELKLAQRRGELYFRYLQRNPGDFLMILHQVCPEVFTIGEEGGNWQHSLLFKFGPGASEKEIVNYIKGLRDASGRKRDIGDDEIKTFLKKHRTFWERWKGSYEELLRLHQWMTKISPKFSGRDGKFNKNELIDKFYEVSATAYARMKRENEPIKQQIQEVMNDKDLLPEEKKTKIAELSAKMRAYLRKEDFIGEEAQKIWEIFAGEDGLFKAMTGLDLTNSNPYFKKFGGVNSDGEINIFFNIAHNWYLNNGDNNPFAADIPYYEVFRTVGLSGEDMIKRTFEANLGTYKEVVSKLGGLENVLWKAAKTGNLEEIKKLHEGIYNTLSGLVGQEYAWRANYILAQIVSNFFAEHSILRDPKVAWLGPLGFLARLGVGGDKISLSKILTKDRHAISMDSNALRTYFEFLRSNKFVNIEPGGAWGMEQLNRVFETSTPEFIFGDVAPKVLWSIAIFMFLIYLKKAWEEAEGKKK